jgi:hypothetical protein
MNLTRQPCTRDYRSRLRADYGYTIDEVRNALPADAKILTRPKAGLIAWRVGDERFYFYFGPYNEITYRLLVQPAYETELPKWFWMIKIEPHPQDKAASHAGPRHGYELSFHFSEAPSIKGSDLVRFVEDCFGCAQEEDIYRWPLFFAHRRPKPWWAIGSADPEEPWQPHYAWSVLGKTEQTKRERHPHYHDYIRGIR